MSAAAFDTSALFKLVTSEHGFEAVGELWAAADVRLCVRIAYVEAHSAIDVAAQAAATEGERLSVVRV